MKRAFLSLLLLCFLIVLLLPSAASAQSIPNWAPNTAYAVDALVMYNGVEYECIQAHTSEVGWEPPNVPALWQPVSGGGGGSSCASAPSTPTGLSSSGTTSSGTTVSWTAVTPPANCSISSYAVLENGSTIGTTSGTSLSVSGLAASTTYKFTVEATDSDGTSGQSSSLSVTTSASGGGGGSGGCAPAWSPTQVYATAGMTASVNGVNYVNNFWTENQNPSTNNGPAGSGQPWTSTGSCSACATPPNAPTNLTASGTTSSSTTLSWTASTAASNCSVTQYTVFENGAAIGSSAGTSLMAVGLSPQTTYTFTVAGKDSFGTSTQSAPLHVTTAAGSGGGGEPAGFTYAVYKDVTINANFNTGQQQSAVTGTVEPVTTAMPNKTLVWAFATGTCGSENWGGISRAMEATNVQNFVAAGKNYIISTGGSAGSFDCPSGQGLINFINTYNSANLVGVDFDIELGQSQTIVDDLINATIAAEAQFPNLQFSFTIQSLGTTAANPVTGGSVGTLVVSEIKRLGLGGNYVVNLMAMDYGSTNANNCVVVNNLCDMGQSASEAAQALNQQSGIPFNHIGLTVDIGQNDTQDEVTSLANVDTMLSFVKSNGLATARFWSFDRDTPTGNGASTMNGNGDPPLAYNNEYVKDLGVQ